MSQTPETAPSKPRSILNLFGLLGRKPVAQDDPFTAGAAAQVLAVSGGATEQVLDMLRKAPPAQLRVEEVLPGFFEAVRDLSYEDFFQQYPDDGRGHTLNADYFRANNYRGQIGHDILKESFMEGQAHFYGSLGTIMGERLRGEVRREIPAHEWQQFFPPVAAELAAQTPEVRAAFDVIYDTARASVQTPGVEGKGEDVFAALQKIWDAYPTLNPNVWDGYDYVMGDDDFVRNVFKRYGFTNHSRADREMCATLEAAQAKTPDEVAKAIAMSNRYMANLETLKTYGPQIASMMMTELLVHMYDDNNKQVHNHPMRYMRLAGVSSGLLSRMSETSDTLIAKDIVSGNFEGRDLLGAVRKASDPNQEQELLDLWRTKAAEWVWKCFMVEKGYWFDTQIARVKTLVERAAPYAVKPAAVPRAKA